MRIAFRLRDALVVFFRERDHLVVIHVTHALDLRAVFRKELHRDQVRKACELFLAVGDQRAELAEAVVCAGEDHAACRVVSAGKALADRDEIRPDAIFAEEEEALVPRAGLNLIAERRRARLAAEAIRLLQEGLVQPDTAVVHHDDLVQESRGLIRRLVPALNRRFKPACIVDRNPDHTVKPALLRLLAERRPESAERLRDHRRAVIARRNAARVVRHDEEHGNLAFAGRFCAVDGIEPREHHLDRGLDRERTRLEVDHAIEHARLARGQNFAHPRVVRRNPVCARNQPPFGGAR